MVSKRRKDVKGTKMNWKRENAELRTIAPVLTYIDKEQFALINFEEETNFLTVN
jgi:hypothetical protein